MTKTWFSHDNAAMLDKHKQALAQQYCSWLHYKWDLFVGDCHICHADEAKTGHAWPYFDRCERCKAR